MSEPIVTNSAFASKITVGKVTTYEGREARLRKTVRGALNLLQPGPCKHGVTCEGCAADWAKAEELLREGLAAE